MSLSRKDFPSPSQKTHIVVVQRIERKMYRGLLHHGVFLQRGLICVSQFMAGAVLKLIEFSICTYHNESVFEKLFRGYGLQSSVE